MIKQSAFGFLILAVLVPAFTTACTAPGGSPEFTNITFLNNNARNHITEKVGPELVHLDAHANATFEPAPFLKNVSVGQWDVVNANEIVCAGDFNGQHTKYFYFQNGKLAQVFGQSQLEPREWENIVHFSWIKILPEQRVFLCVSAWGKKPLFVRHNLDTGSFEIVPAPFSDTYAFDTKPLRSKAGGDLIFLARDRVHHTLAADEKTTAHIVFLDSVSLATKRTVAVPGVEIERILSLSADEKSIIAYGKLAGLDGHVDAEIKNPNLFKRAFISVNLATGEFTKLMDDNLPGVFFPHVDLAIFARRYVIMDRTKRLPPPAVGGYFGEKSYLIDLQKAGWTEITYPFDYRQKIMQYILPVEIDSVGTWMSPISQDTLIFGQ